MELLTRLLIGIPIFMIAGFISMLLFGFLTTVINGIAYFLARLVRNIFGIKGYWIAGLTLATTIVHLGQMGAGFCFFWALLLYSFLYPRYLEDVYNYLIAGTAFSLVLIWMPGTFLLGLFVPSDYED